MQRLGINTIRVYNLDPSLDHGKTHTAPPHHFQVSVAAYKSSDMCASIFNSVGIYLLLDVNSPLPNDSLNPGDLTGSYNSAYLSRIFAVVEAFKNFPNLLGFFSGNEVMQRIGEGSTVPPYVRAVTRDLKNYIANNSPRNIPVGYSAADVRDILPDSFAYLSCDIDGQSSDVSRIDFFGLNSYSWCGDLTFEEASYDKLIQIFSNTTIPIFFSEYGCNDVQPRQFFEVPAVYGPEMTSVMSGGIIYEYTEEANDFGLVDLHGNGTAALLVDYDNLQRRYNELDIERLQSGNASATALQSPECSSSLIREGGFADSFDIPSTPSGGQTLIDNGIENPNIGELVPITETAVPMAVYGSNGGLLRDLAIKPLPQDQSNTPNGQDTTGSTSASPSGTSSAGGMPTSTSGVGKLAISLLLGVIAIVGFSIQRA